MVVIEPCKTCIDCQKSLSLGHFHKKGPYFDSRCKPCALKHKKNQYLIKKRRKVNTFNNTIINYATECHETYSDLVSALQSLLLEEFIDENGING